MPLTYFLNTPFQNRPRVSANPLGTVFICADFTVPVEEVRRKLHGILASSEKWDRQVWGLQVANISEQTVGMRALMSATNPFAAWDRRPLYLSSCIRSASVSFDFSGFAEIIVCEVLSSKRQCCGVYGLNELKDLISSWLGSPSFDRVVAAVVGLAIIVAVVQLLRRVVLTRVQDIDTRYRVRKVIAFIGYLAAFVLLTTVFSDRFRNVTVALGVAGAGIAFALQEVIGSIAGWLAISVGNFFAVGDRVQLGGIVGDVIDIGILRTTLMETGQWVNGDLYSGRIVRVANSFVFKEPVFNYSADFPFLWDEIVIPVKYGSDAGLAREILQRAAVDLLGEYAASARKTWEVMVRKYRIEEAAVTPMVTLAATDNWLEYTIRYVVDYKRRRITRDQLYTRILDEIDRTGGRVAIASATVQLVDLPQIDVSMKDGPVRTDTR